MEIGINNLATKTRWTDYRGPVKVKRGDTRLVLATTAMTPLRSMMAELSGLIKD